jgi:hypothetical protein
MPFILLKLKASSLWDCEVRRVGGQEQEFSSSRLDELPYPLSSMSPEPIEHNHLPFFQGRCQKVLDVSLEDLRIGRPFYDHSLTHARFEGDGGHNRGVLALRLRGTLP